MAKEKKIAVVSDIHANLPALQAVLEDIKSQDNIETIFNLGDNVGYEPFPNEVIEIISSDRFVNITGNYDLKVLKFPDKKKKWSRTKKALKYFAFKWTYKQLTGKSKKFMKSLPKQKKLNISGKKVLLCHGSPESIDEHLTPEIAHERYVALSINAEADVVLFGHSHLQFAKNINDTVFLNPGSVGRPEGTNGMACYAVLKIGEEYISYEHRQVEYDVNLLIEKLKSEKIPKEFEQVFMLGKNLDDVIKYRDLT